MGDAHRFGFAGAEDAARHLDALLVRIAAAFDGVAGPLDRDWREALHARLAHNVAILGNKPAS